MAVLIVVHQARRSPRGTLPYRSLFLRPVHVRPQGGFTLLEMLVALFIATMIMTMVYGALKQLLDGHERLSLREQQLRNQMVIQNTLLRDFGNALPNEQAELRLDETAFGMKLNGQVIPGMMLGPRVEVRYAWMNDAMGGAQWSRTFVDLADQEPKPGWEFVLSDGLQGVRYELLVGDTWMEPDAYREGFVQALRWHFLWSEIGEWPVVVPLAGAGL